MVGAAHSMPAYALLPTLLISLTLMVLSLRGIGSVAASFLAWALYLRFVAGAFHQFTFQRSPLGISYNALSSIIVFVVGLFVIKRRALSFISIAPFIPVLTFIIVSGIINKELSGMATALTKYAYLIILIISSIDSFQDVGADRLFRTLLNTFFLPLCLQLISVFLHIVKPGETDGADSYIGGYYHEAAFSVMLLAAVLISCLIKNIKLLLKLALIFYSFTSIVLANYRTAILSVLPLVGVSMISSVPRVFALRQRLLVVGAMIIGLVGLLTSGAMIDSQRFNDLGTASDERSALIKRPELFTREDRQVMSSRSYIWSMYYYKWVDAPIKNKIVGFGPESWIGAFSVYAHNTLISALYETGILGTISLLVLWGAMLGVAIAAKFGPRIELISAHLSFFVLNMATMPMWQIEGMIYYGILCGYTIYRYNLGKKWAP